MGFQLLWPNRDGCHMWGRKCSLLPGTFHSLWGIHDFTHSLNIFLLYITEFVSLFTD